MNILYITNYNEIAKHSGQFINDYQNDLLFYGLTELYGTKVVDSTKIIHLYKDNKDYIDKKHLWGGMTSFWLLDGNELTDRTYIPEKIQDKFYDLIIYGAWRRCKEYYDIVSKTYPDDKIILIDGNDEPDLDPIYNKHKYFKRELNLSHPNLFPISFAFPTNKFAEPTKNKTQDYGTVIPGQPETYVFKTEDDYYQDYQKSYFGVTMKKAGWETMRTHEIIGNYCLPYFIDIDKCPNDTLFNYPKELLYDANSLVSNFNIENYYLLLEQTFDYWKKNLSTKALAEYVISRSI